MRGMLAGLLLALTACSGYAGSETPEPRASETPYSSWNMEHGFVHCGGPAIPAASLPLPDGAVKARICSSGSFEWRPPQEELTAHDQVLGLVETINSLEPLEDQEPNCFAVGGLGFTIMLSQKDGTVLSVSGDTGGCGTVEIGGVLYATAQSVLDDFISRIEGQRSTKQPPRVIESAPLDCAAVGHGLGLSPSLTGRLTDGVRAVACWFPHAEPEPRWRQATVMPNELEVLLQDLRRRGTRKQEGYTEPFCDGRRKGAYNQQLLVQTSWGDVLATQSVCEEYMVSEHRFWHPGPRAVRILADLRATAR